MGHRVVRAQEIGPEAWTWKQVVTEAEGTDMLLWVQTTNIDPDGGYWALGEFERTGVPTVSFHLDLYWGLARQVQIMEAPFWRTKWCLTADGGHDREFRRNGVNHHWSPPAIYEPWARRGTPQERRYDVLFIGSIPYGHPEHAEARREIVMWLRSRYPGFRLVRSGVRGLDLSDLVASATVVVGDSCLAGRSPRYWSERAPEVIGRGGFLLHPYVVGMDEQYIDGEHLRYFEAGDIAQMSHLIDHYLSHPSEARAIGQAGQHHVRAYHTYTIRMERLLETVGLSGA